MACVGVRLTAQLGAGFGVLKLRFIVESAHLNLSCKQMQRQLCCSRCFTRKLELGRAVSFSLLQLSEWLGAATLEVMSEIEIKEATHLL